MKREWNDDWRKELYNKAESVYLRLCDCCNTKNDVIVITKYMHKYNSEKSIEDCLERTWTWLCEWNGQDRLSDWIDKNYDMLLKECS